MPTHILLTTVVGSYPQLEWPVNRAMLSKVVPRTRLHDMWRLPVEHPEEAQDDATIVAIRDMERAGIDIVTDGEIRRESYSNRFATAVVRQVAQRVAVLHLGKIFTRGGGTQLWFDRHRCPTSMRWRCGRGRSSEAGLPQMRLPGLGIGVKCPLCLPEPARGGEFW